MLINLRNALMTGKRLPYDAEVEYLETDGDAYVSTGITPTNDATVETIGLFGYASASSGRRFLFSDGNQNVTHYCEVNASAQYGAGTAYISQTLSADTMYNATATFTSALASYSIDINGTQYTSSTTSYPSSAWRELVLFRLSANYRGSGQRIGACKIYVNNTLVRDYIPVRKGTVGYLYDRVSGALFGNAGTGDFVVGQDVVPVEYIESHGTEYINLGILNFSAFSVGLKPKDKATPHYDTAYLGWNNNGSRTTGVYAATVGTFTIRNNSNATVTATPQTWDMFHDILYSNGVVSVDGAQYSLVMTASTAFDFGLFSIIKPNAIPSKCAISYFNAKDQNANDILGMKPVRVGTEGAMMDVLTRRIYRNAGTGAFTYGNDLKYPIPA